MKKLISYSIVFTLVGIYFSSCTTLSVNKRRYNKGYHISYTKARQSVKANEKTETLAVQTKSVSPFYILKDITDSRPIINNLNQVKSHKDLGVVASNDKQKKNVVLKKNILPILNYKRVSLENTSAQIQNVYHKLKKSDRDSGDGDGLSLFWIVILVLLILWAVGLLAGGFGIGGLINILLVIALILLILWLLKIL